MCNFVFMFPPSFFQILPNLKEKQRYKFFCYRFFSMLLSTFVALVVVELVRYKPVKGW